MTALRHLSALVCTTLIAIPAHAQIAVGDTLRLTDSAGVVVEGALVSRDSLALTIASKSDTTHVAYGGLVKCERLVRRGLSVSGTATKVAATFAAIGAVLTVVEVSNARGEFAPLALPIGVITTAGLTVAGGLIGVVIAVPNSRDEWMLVDPRL